MTPILTSSRPLRIARAIDGAPALATHSERLAVFLAPVGVLFGEFVAVRAVRLARVVASALRQHVLDVVHCRPGEQVVRPHARWIVATVQHVKAVRDWAEVEHPGIPVCSRSLPRFGVRASDIELAVPARQLRSCPEPAPIALLNVAPEANLRWRRRSNHVGRMLPRHQWVQAMGCPAIDLPVPR